MLLPATFKFLKGLKANNNKEWFEANRKQYNDAKANVELFVGQMLVGLTKIDSNFANLVPKNCTFRINRDVRFSKDKSPYKTNMGVYFNPAGKAVHSPGFYMHIEPGNCFAASGIWMPEANVLAAIRQEIDYNFNDLKKIINNPAFKKQFPAGFSKEDILQRPPKGYDINNPAIEFLKLKSFIVQVSISDDEVLSPSFSKTLLKIFEKAAPLNSFLAQSVH